MPFQHYLLFALLLLVCTSARAQDKSRWRPGYYITTAEQTVRGQINDNFFNDRVTAVRFRADKQAATQRIDLNDITHFEVGGRRYEVHEVTFTDAPRTTNDLQTAEQLKSTTEQGALRVHFEGQAGLLQYVDRNGMSHYFARQAGGKVTYLPYARLRQVEAIGGTSREVTDNSWRSVLVKDFLYACPDIDLAARRTSYKQADLIKLFERYYNCINMDAEYRIERRKGVIELMPTIGAVLSRHSMDPFVSFSERFVWEDPSILSPLFGLQLRFREEARSRFAGKLGLFYHTGSASEEGPAILRGSSASDGLRRNYDYSESALSADLSAEYILKRFGELSLAVDAGVRYERQFSASEIRTQDPTPGFPRQSRELKEEGFGKIAPFAGLTATRKRLNLSLRVSQQSNKYIEQKDDILRVMLLAAYRL